MGIEKMNPEEIFNIAIEIADKEARAAFIDKMCGENQQLRAEVESLLRAHQQAGSFLNAPPFDADVTLDTSPLTEGPGTIIGRYKILELIGEGGFGAVYMAEQQEPIRRRVALKIIKLGMDTRQVIARFEVERQALAMMDHPNIAKVLDAGATETGRPYFVMELVKGIPITEYCDKNNLNTQQRLELFIDVCKAVQHAHQKSIIHRDIKPSNVMITLHDGKPVPKVIDFGIAKATSQHLTEKTLFTRYAQMIGTPEYMSPEQAEMSGLDIDTRTDIYSLGVLLYELLTGSTPFDAKKLREAGYAEMQRIIRETEPPRPSTKLNTMGDALTDIAKHRQTNPDLLPKLVRGDLDWIAMKSLEKDRTRRYETANELAMDIQRHLSDEPVEASPPSKLYRFRKLVQKHRRTVVVVITIAAILVIGLLVSTTMYFIANHARQKEAVARTEAEQAREKEAVARSQAEQSQQAEQEQRKVAEQKAEDLRQAMYVNSIQLADVSYQQGNIRCVHEALNSCPNDLRGWEWYRLNYISDQPTRTLYGHKDRVWSVALSPDGKRIISGSWDGTIRLWDLETGAQLAILRGHLNCVCSIAISPDGTRIASCGDDGTIRVWDSSNGQQLMKLYDQFYWNDSLAFSPDGKYVALNSDDSTIRVWDVAIGEKVMTLRGHEEYTCCLVFSPDGKHIISGGDDKTIRVWDVNSGSEVMTLRGHKGGVYCVSMRPDAKRIISGGEDGTIRLWDAVTGKELMTLHGHRNRVHSISYDRNGRFIVSGSADRTVKVWNAETGEELMTLRGHNDWIYSVLFSHDGKKIISGSGDKTIKIWDLSTSREPMPMGIGGRAYSISFSPDGKRIASAYPDEKAIKVWDTATGAELMSLSGHKEGVYEVVFSPDGKRIITAGGDKTIKVWDAITGKEIMTLYRHDKYVITLACSPDGRQIVSGDIEGNIKVWDAITGVEVKELKGHRQRIRSLIYSPDGTRIISCSRDRTIKIWDSTTGAESWTFKGHKDYITCIAVSPDGKRIASGGYDGTIKIFAAETGNGLMTISGRHNRILSLSFSPDGRRIVSAGWDGTVTVLDTTTGVELMTFVGENKGYMYRATFSPDGNTIAAVGRGGIVLWETTMPTDGYGPRQVVTTAMKEVEQLYNQYGFYYKVMEQLEANKTLDENIRRTALQIVKSRLRLDAYKLWKIVSASGVEAKVYQEILEKAEMANRLEPNDPSILHALGVSQYRVGAYQQALETLTQTERVKSDANEPRAHVVAVIAMALHKLGRAEDAQAALSRMRGFYGDEKEILGLNYYSESKTPIIEAEKLFAGDNSKLCSLLDYIKADRINKAVDVLEQLQSSKEVSRPLLDGAIKLLSRACYERARRIWRYAAVDADIISAYEMVIRIDPNNASALNDWAWLQVTCPETQLLNSSRVVAAATKACQLTNWKNPEYISTLAAACSEANDFDTAIKWQKEALDLLREEKDKDLLANYEARLKLYESSKPYHKGSLWSFTDGELVAWWKMDEVKDGNVIDSSGNGLDGKLIGDAKIISDPQRGNVLSLDGDGDYVDCGNNPAFNITGAITIIAWVKVKKFDKISQAIVDRGDSGWGLYRDNDNNNLHFYVSFQPKYGEDSLWTSASGEKNVNNGRWHHIAGVYDGKRISLFIDGILDSQLSASGSFTKTYNYSFCIGNDEEEGGSDWNGLIDDLRIYSYALSEAEVKALYEGKDPPLRKE